MKEGKEKSNQKFVDSKRPKVASAPQPIPKTEIKITIQHVEKI